MTEAMRHLWDDHKHLPNIQVCTHCGVRRRRTSARRKENGIERCRSIFVYSRNALDPWGVRYIACTRPITQAHLDWKKYGQPRKATMTNPNKTEIIVVLDRSGSMAGMKADVQGGFAKFIEDQRKIPGECLVTLAQFDNEYDVVYEAKPLADVPHLELQPRGGTALLDAIGRTIDTVGLRLSHTREQDRPGKVVIVIITDGHENQSQKYTREDVRRMITIQREKFSWEFLFLGAQEDAIDVAQSYGIPRGRAATYQDAKAAYGGISANIGALRSGGPMRDQQEVTREHESK